MEALTTIQPQPQPSLVGANSPSQGRRTVPCLSLTEKEQLTFDVLSDTGSDVAEEYGIAFDLSDEPGAVHDGFGFGLQRVNAGRARTLPLRDLRHRPSRRDPLGVRADRLHPAR